MDFRDEIDNITFNEKDVTHIYIDDELIWTKFVPELDILVTPTIRSFDYDNYNHIVDFNISCSARYYDEYFDEYKSLPARVICEETEEEWDIIGYDEFDTSYMFSNENSKEFVFKIIYGSKKKFERVTVTIPYLNGTENIVSWSNLPNNTSNGIFTSHGSYLEDVCIDNYSQWEIQFSYKYSEDNNGVGLMLCSNLINPFTDDKNRLYGFSTYQGSVPFNGAGVQWMVSPDSISSAFIQAQQDSWTVVNIKKQIHNGHNDLISLKMENPYGSYLWDGFMNSMAEWDTVFLGTRDNPQQRNTGSNILYTCIAIFEKNKKIKPELMFLTAQNNPLPINYETGDQISFKIKLNTEIEEDYLEGLILSLYYNNNFSEETQIEFTSNKETNLITIPEEILFNGLKTLTVRTNSTDFLSETLKEINISIGYIIQIIEYPSQITEGTPSSIKVKVSDYLGNPVSNQSVSIVEYIEDYGWEQVSQGGTTDENGIVIINPAYISDKPFRATMFRSSVQYNSETIENIPVIPDISNLPIMKLRITGNSFSTTYSNTPFIYNGRVFVDWGDDTGLIEYTGGKLTHTYSSSDDYTVKIYGDITSIDDSCFDSCANLTSIVIPSSVTSLGKFCFASCIELTSIVIPNSVISLGRGCFLECDLTSIIIPNSVTSLGTDCFYFCTSLTSIILNWNTNNEILTYNQDWIKFVSPNLLFYIPEGTTSLYTAKGYPLEKLIELSDNIMELKITGSNFNTYSSTPFIYNGRVFVDWGDNTGLVEYTGGQLSHTYASSSSYSVKIYGNITNLNNYCFHSRTGLTSITLSESIITLGRACFTGCTSLTSITLPNTLTTIGDACFPRCIKLSSLSIPKTVTSIGSGSFNNCSVLTEIVLLWDSSSEIVSYNDGWLLGASSFNHFLIPYGTTSLYTAKGYPLEKLEEEIIYNGIELTTDKSILSYADNETCTLTARLTYNNNPVNISGETIEFYNGTTSMGTAQTNSNGVATMTYSSSGVGDVIFFSATKNKSNTITVKDAYFVAFKGDEKWYAYSDRDTERTYSYTANNELYINTMQNGVFEKYVTPNGDWKLTFDIKGNTKYNAGGRFGIRKDNYSTSVSIERAIMALEIQNSTYYLDISQTLNTGLSKTTISAFSSYTTFSFVAEGTTLSCYRDGALVNSFTGCDWLNDQITLFIHQWASVMPMYIRNVVLEPI